MPWYRHIAAFLHHNLPRMRATRRTNPALLAAVILSRHQRKKRHFRFLSNPRFDPIRPQCTMMPAICQLAGLKGRTPIMIDWSDLGSQA